MARAALCGWFLPLLMALLTAFSSTPAQAQTPPQTVVVLDFSVSPGLDPLLGRKAADGLAVELGRAGDFEVVTRQKVDEAVGQQAGLQPPFNDTAQIRLAQAVGARSVFSGRVVAVEITPGRAARVRLEVRQLDAGTGDYINGTDVTETTEQKLTPVANQILVDEALNKSVFSAVRSVKQTNLPEGKVLNTTRDDVELSIGTRNGVAKGQRYSVLRDIFNRGRGVTERLKTGEITIIRTEADQSVGVLSAGGTAGIRTGDYIRKIFVGATSPVSYALNSGGSVTPVTAPPISLSGQDRGGAKGFARKTGKGLVGLFALAALIGLAGAGGSNSSASSSPTVDQPTLRDPNAIYPEAQISFRAGFTGIATGLRDESIVGYLLYRGTSPGFAANADSLQAFVDARNTASVNQRVTLSDPRIASQFAVNTRLVTITSSVSTTTLVGISDVVNGLAVGGSQVNSIVTTPTTITLNFTQRPSTIGQTYYYRVERLTAERTLNTSTTVTLRPVQSRVSRSTGGFTPLVRPLIVQDTTQYNLDDFRVVVNFDPTPYNDQRVINGTFFNSGFDLQGSATVASGADQFQVQVSTSTSFSPETTFTSPILSPPNTTPLGNIVFNRDTGLGPSIRIPGVSDSTIGGTILLFLRVRSRNSQDAIPTFRLSPVISITAVQGSAQTLTSRFISPNLNGNAGGLGVRTRPGLGARTASGSIYSPTQVRKPQ